MTDNKEIKIQFAPGAFDTFDGTQEELDALMEEIHKMFEGKSMEEIAEISRPISDEDFDEFSDDVKLQLMRGYDDTEELPNDYKRKLQ
jgi:hypothetical protein